MSRLSRVLFLLLCVLAVQAEPPGRSPSAGGAESFPHSFQLAFPTTSSYPLLFPVAQEDFLSFSSTFGWRISPTLKILAYHNGVDIEAVPKAQVVAAADGWVDELWPPPDGWYRGHPLYGGLIILRHSNGLRTLYAHLSAVLVVGWQAVRAGQVIGRIGTTGKAVGEHLHFEVQMDWMTLNPLLYLKLPR